MNCRSSSAEIKAVDAGLALEVQCFPHFVKAGTDAGGLEPLVDIGEQFALLDGQHGSRGPACEQTGNEYGT
jgi:hypothetical protein